MSHKANLAGLVHARRPLTDLDILDSHAHMGPYNGFFIPDPSPEAMLAVMDRCGVRRACFSSHLAIGPDAAAGNDYTASMVARWPDRFLGYITINPHQDPAGEVERWQNSPQMVGVKLHPDLHSYHVAGEKYRPAWELADRTRRYVLVHTFASSPYCDPDYFGEIAARYPNASILLGHSGATDTGFEKSIRVAKAHENIYLELCGSWMTGKWLQTLVQEIGAHRVIYGSDFPFIDMRYSLGRALFAPITPEERLLVMGGNMRRLIAQAVIV